MMKVESKKLRRIGIEYYASSTSGIDGEIKRRISDFIVEEVSEEHVCSIKAFSDKEKKEIEFKDIENSDNKKYLILELEKYNMDLNYAIRKIARWLQSSRYIIGFAGVKDKRAITCQRISIKEPDIKRLKEFKSRYISLRPICWSDNQIEIGMLEGNIFKVTIRKIEIKEEEIERRVKECFKEISNGVPNYFGSQRFGGIRGLTHVVGKELLKGNFKEGVLKYLCEENEEEDEEIKNARRNLKETLDYSKASKEFPLKYRYERAIIHHLCKYPKDYVNAFGKLPKSLRYMFTHAYQGYLFNKAISRRFELGIGLKRLEDDVLDKDGNPTASLIGYETEFGNSTQSKIEQQILEEEGITKDLFYVKKMPEISSKGSRRSIIVKPERLEIVEIGKDEFNEGKNKITISFYLPKGSYATVVINEIIKNGLC
ncbi:MAG: tRNA pseudouridine(13) synthase TruD [Candidatus Diapherotrites archaeon]|nr:tRNA pseudouridine(13) synthase TruD [Candidatus Diapherotrites archaeon]